jgi:hypothetical protein
MKKLITIQSLLLLLFLKESSAQSKFNFSIFAGTNHSLLTSLQNVKTSGGFNTRMGLSGFESTSYIPVALGVNVDYQISENWNLISGLEYYSNNYRFSFNKFSDPSVFFANPRTEYVINSITIPIAVSREIIQKFGLICNVEVGLNLNINRVGIYGLGAALAIKDSSLVGLGVSQNFSPNNKLSIGSRIGFEVASKRYLKNLWIYTNLHLQFYNGISTTNEVMLINQTKNKSEYHFYNTNIAPSFISFGLRYKWKKVKQNKPSGLKISKQ